MGGAVILTYGETMAALKSATAGPLRMGGRFALSMAGAESTVAIGVGRLGGTARWVGVVGDDELGSLITMRLRAEGVLTDGVVTTDAAPTSLIVKERRTAAVTRVSYYRRHGAGALLAPAHVEEAHVREARVLHVTGITPALSRSASPVPSPQPSPRSPCPRTRTPPAPSPRACWPSSSGSTAPEIPSPRERGTRPGR